MQEPEILSLISSILEGELSQQGINIAIKSNFQPSALEKNPTIYLTITSVKYKGFPKLGDQIKATEIEHIKGQLYESTVKIAGQVVRDLSSPINTSSLTSLMLTTRVANILQSDDVRILLKNKGIGVMRVEEITQSFYSEDEASKNQTVASFNFIICYEEVSKTTSPVTRSFEFKQYRV